MMEKRSWSKRIGTFLDSLSSDENGHRSSMLPGNEGSEQYRHELSTTIESLTREVCKAETAYETALVAAK